MQIRTIQLLLALAEHRHFGRAADACGISQSAFSSRLQSLELELGVRLVERGARFERFTESGERLLPRFRDIIAQIDALRQETKSGAATLAGHLKTAVIPTQLTAAGELAAAVRSRYPFVKVTIHSPLVQSNRSGLGSINRSLYACSTGLACKERPVSHRGRAIEITRRCSQIRA